MFPDEINYVSLIHNLVDIKTNNYIKEINIT